jgi:hypothetical protein
MPIFPTAALIALRVAQQSAQTTLMAGAFATRQRARAAKNEDPKPPTVSPSHVQYVLRTTPEGEQQRVRQIIDENGKIVLEMLL